MAAARHKCLDQCAWVLLGHGGARIFWGGVGAGAGNQENACLGVLLQERGHRRPADAQGSRPKPATLGWGTSSTHTRRGHEVCGVEVAQHVLASGAAGAPVQDPPTGRRRLRARSIAVLE